MAIALVLPPRKPEARPPRISTTQQGACLHEAAHSSAPGLADHGVPVDAVPEASSSQSLPYFFWLTGALTITDCLFSGSLERE